MLDEGAVTRRRALALGAVTGVGALLARPFSALATAGGGSPSAFGLDVRASDFPDGGRVSRVIRTRRRFDLVGLRGARGDVEIRVRAAGGSWTRWVALAVRGDHAPDTGSGQRASDPVWTGGSNELQLRAARPVRGRLRLHMVAVPASARRVVRPRAVARAAQATFPPDPPPIIPRSGWGGDKVRPREDPSYGAVQMGFVHHTVNANNYGPQDSAGIVLAIAKYHRDTNGWNDIGYNFVVDQYGQIFEGRAGGIDQPVIGAQAQGWNSNSTGVAIIGTFQGVAPPAAALEAVAHVLGWKLSLHGVPIEGTVSMKSLGGTENRYPAGRMVTFQRISGHRDGCKTTCPGDAAYALLANIRKRARKHAFALPAGEVAQVSLEAAATAVVWDEQAVLSGIVLRGDGAPAAGETVVIERDTGKGWKKLAQTTAGEDGAWSLSIAWRATGDVRAVADGGTSPVTHIDCIPTITVRRAARKIYAGRTVRVRGAVRPKGPVWVLVEQRVSGRWRRVGSVRAPIRAGAYDVKVTLAKPGVYRVTPKAGTPAANAVARAQQVRAVKRAKRARATKKSTVRKPARKPAAKKKSGGVAARR